MIEAWKKDPEFMALPKEKRTTIMRNYFDREMADDEFRGLPEDKQESIRTNFLSRYGYAPEKSRYQKFIESPNMQGLIGATKETGKTAVDETVKLAGDVLLKSYLPDTVYQSSRGLLQGMAGFGAMALSQTLEAAKQLAGKGTIDWEVVKAVGEEQEKLFEYLPTDPGAQAVLGAIGSVPAGVKLFFDQIAEQYKDKPNVYAGIKTLGDLAELGSFGKVFGALKGAKVKPAVDFTVPKDTVMPPLDATFAKDQVRQNIAKERASTPQRPLDKLRRAEEGLREGAEYDAKVAEYAELFDKKLSEAERKDLARQRIAAEQPKTVQRPLERIARKEETLAAEREYEAKVAEYAELFDKKLSEAERKELARKRIAEEQPKVVQRPLDRVARQEETLAAEREYNARVKEYEDLFRDEATATPESQAPPPAAAEPAPSPPPAVAGEAKPGGIDGEAVKFDSYDAAQKAIDAREDALLKRGVTDKELDSDPVLVDLYAARDRIGQRELEQSYGEIFDVVNKEVNDSATVEHVLKRIYDIDPSSPVGQYSANEYTMRQVNDRNGSRSKIFDYVKEMYGREHNIDVDGALGSRSGLTLSGQRELVKKLTDKSAAIETAIHEYFNGSDTTQRTGRKAIADESVTPPPQDNIAGVGVQKQPWEMTRDEFDTFWIERSKRGVEEEVTRNIHNLETRANELSEVIKKDPRNPAAGQIKTEIDRINNEIESQRVRLTTPILPPSKFMDDAKYRWHQGIDAAIREGKPVPPEVLKDYQDLAPKPAHEAVAPKEAVAQMGNAEVVGNVPIEGARVPKVGGIELTEAEAKALEFAKQQDAKAKAAENEGTAKKVADGLGVEYNGVDSAGQHMFTDPVTSDTFTVKKLGEAHKRLGGLREKKGLPVPEPESPRGLVDIIQDINTAFGQKGAVGKDIGLTPEQQAAYLRLSKDFDKIKRNAARTGQDMAAYLESIGYDPKVAAMLQRRADELPKYAGSVNLTKQDIPEEFKQIQADIAKPKKAVPWAKTVEASTEILSDYEKTARVLRKKGHTAAEIDAVRQVNVNAMSDLKRLVKDSDDATFNDQFNKYRNDIFQKVSDASSEVGRALNIHKREVSIARLSKAFAELKRGLNAREKKEFLELNLENPAEVRRFMNRLGDPKLRDYFLEYWYNSVLSGIPTHGVNILSNTSWIMWQVPHRAMAALVDLPIARLTGRQRTRYLNEILPMLAGYKTGWVRGKHMAGQMMREGKIKDFESKWAQEMETAEGAFERSPNKFLRKVAPAVTVPTRALRAIDVWGRSIAYDGHARSLARRASNEKGLKGKEREAFEKDFVENLSEEAHQECMRMSEYSTFMDAPDPVSRWAMQVRNIPVIGAVSRVTILPFVNTIANLQKRGIEMTPGVGLVKEAVSRGMGRGSATPEVIAKQIEGAVIALYVINKAAQGDITGPMPERPEERDAWYRMGKQPWSIRYGDTWYSYRRIEPFNTVIASSAIAYQAIKDAKDDATAAEIFGNVASGYVDNLIDGAYFSGLKAILDKYERKRALPRAATAWVPYSGFWRSVNRAYEAATEGDVKVREGNEWMKAFSQVIPGLPQQMPAKLDIWGKESVIPGGILRQWLPYKWSQETDDPLENELADIDMYPALPDKNITIDGESVEIPEDLYRSYCIEYGAGLKENWTKLITKPSWPDMDKKAKERALERVREKISNSARKRLRREMASR